MKKFILIYLLTIILFGGGILAVIHRGDRLTPVNGSTSPITLAHPAIEKTPPPDNSVNRSLAALRENLHDPLSQALLQIVLIVVLAKIFGTIFARIGQPAVIGEMLAGIILGPSLFGATLPGAFKMVFPPESLGSLRMLSQVGVILFMFVVGMDLDVKHLRGKANTALLVSHVSIIFPLFLGVAYSYFIFENLAGSTASFLAFALFMGTAMSITAFPVLARIIEERGLLGTVLGSTAITCAAVDDITAWSVLALVVAIAKATGMASVLVTVGLAIVFIGLMLFGVKPALARLLSLSPQSAANPGKGAMVGVLIVVFISAWCTEIIGIHALFGAFLAGIAMPADVKFRARLRERLENFSSALLLPLFFAFTGLRTQIGLVNGWENWSIALILIGLATLGKLGGAMVTAKATGMNWSDSFALGALMNTRGLVELIVLNLGLDLGILSPRVFAMMVIMALVTTSMTGPLLSLGKFFNREISLTSSKPA